MFWAGLLSKGGRFDEACGQPPLSSQVHHLWACSPWGGMGSRVECQCLVPPGQYKVAMVGAGCSSGGEHGNEIETLTSNWKEALLQTVQGAAELSGAGCVAWRKEVIVPSCGFKSTQALRTPCRQSPNRGPSHKSTAQAQLALGGLEKALVLLLSAAFSGTVSWLKVLPPFCQEKPSLFDTRR